MFSTKHKATSFVASINMKPTEQMFTIIIKDVQQALSPHDRAYGFQIDSKQN